MNLKENELELNKKTIQQYLNEVDYSFNDYIPSREALMFFQFIKEVNGGSEENRSPLIHSLMIEKMINPSNRVAIMAFRGASKSSIIEYLILYLACFNELGSIKNPKFIMFIANSIEGGVKTFRRNLENRYFNSSFLQKMIPNQNLKFQATDTTSNKSFFLSENDINDIVNAGRNITDIRLEFRNINNQPLAIRSYGIKSGIRGAREYNTRPTLAIFDDILNDDDARSDSILEGIEEIIYNAVPYALHPTNQKIIWVGTPFNSKDPLYKAIESGRWDSLVLPVCEKYPCTKSEFKGAWVDRFNYEAVSNSYKDSLARDKSNGFYQEMMLRIISDEQLLITLDDIIFVRKENYADFNRDSFNYYITTDFAFSEKTSADFSVISVWAYTFNKTFILVDGICARQTMDKNIKDLFKLVNMYKPIQVGIEVTGQQQGFINWILEEQIRQNVFFDIKEVRPVKDKFSRFLAFSPFYHRKKILFYDKLKNTAYMNEFLDEILKVSKTGFKSKHDDILDTNSQLLDLDTYAPNETTDMYQEILVNNDNNFFTNNKNNDTIQSNYIF